MAVQTKSVAINGTSATWNFTFTKPAAGYIKNHGLNVTPVGGDSSGTGVNFLADVDNGDGTMTGTIKLGDPTVVGSVEVSIIDTLT
jgi:hypothetical protein